MAERLELKELFHRVSALSDAERLHALRDLERESPQLAEEIRSLIEASAKASPFFEVLEEGMPRVLEEVEEAAAAVMTCSDRKAGARVGSYEIVERIGSGGMGEVYRARHVRMGRMAALKFLPARLLPDEDARRRIVHEARAAGALEHVNLCTIFDVGRTRSGELYIAMAYYDGETLKKRLARGPLTLHDALGVAQQMAAGLAEAHRKGIVHRDVKPANVMITPDGTVKLLDFGIALMVKERTGAPEPHSAVGTVAYMSPEQSLGRPVDARTDVWAVGVVLYEMLTGKKPFGAGPWDEVLAAIRESDPPDPGEGQPEIPKEVRNLVRRCMSRRPADRYQTAGALLADLHHAARNDISSNHPRSTVTSGPRPKPARIFLSYSRGSTEDVVLARALTEHLSRSQRVFMDRGGSIGPGWAATIDSELRGADFVVALLSPEALGDEMVLAELETAKGSAEAGAGPRILPVLQGDATSLPHPLDMYLAGCPVIPWRVGGDVDDLASHVLSALDTPAGESTAGAVAMGPAGSGSRQSLPYPSAASVQVESPEGTMDPESFYYVTRPGDRVALDAITVRGVTITIKGSRRMGKSSLLLRVMRRAEELGKRVAYIDFQRMSGSLLRSADTFYPAFCRSVARELEIDLPGDGLWDRSLGAEHRCTLVLERRILGATDAPIVLAMDEVDRMFDAPFRSDFFAMLRGWHNDRAMRPAFRRLDLALVTSTEPYQLIEDLNHSPFNVGEVVDLADFTPAQIADLNDRYERPFSGSELSRLVHIVGGHPYLVRRALYLVAADRMDAGRLLEEAADDEGPFGDHLRHYLFRLVTAEHLADAMRMVLRDGTCPSEEIYWRLRGAGLVVRRGSRIEPRCGLYERFLARHL